MNHRTKTKEIRVVLNNISDELNKKYNTLNVVYSMCPYYKFDKDSNPILIIHDRNNGVYMLNIVTLKKSQIIEKES